jgi:cobalt-zinc-cadmium efflux system outer membrane protein
MELELEVLKNKIKLSVKKNYIDVLYALYLEDLRREELRLARELHEAVRLRKESGASNEMDLLQAELNLAEANNQINDADRALHIARYNLFNSIGLLPSEQTYEIDFQDSLQTREDLIDQEEAINTLMNQPEYIAKSHLIQSQDTRIRAVKSELLPDLSIGYLRQDFGTGYKFNGIEGGLSIPLWGTIKQKGAIEQETLKKNEIEWSQTSILLDLKKRVELAWHGYENSKIILERFQSGMKAKAEKLQSLSLEAYRLGQLDLLKLIEAQRLYLRGQERYLNAVHDYYLRLAELEYFLEPDLVF